MSKLRWLRIAGLGAGVCLGSAMVHAVPIAYEFNGVVTGLQKDAGLLLPEASIGDAFQLRLWLDDGLAPLGLGSASATYGEVVGLDRGPGFVSAISASMRVGDAVLAIAFPSATAVDAPVNSMAVMDGNRVLYSGGRQVDVEGMQWTAASSRGSANRGSAFLRYWNEHPMGTPLAGAAGVLNGVGLPTSLAGVGSVSPRADFGFFWGAPDENFIQSYIGANLTSANVVLDAAPNPAPNVEWPTPDAPPPDPGTSAANPLLPDVVFADPMTGGSTFQFNIDVQAPGTTIWIDPPVAVGYVYTLEAFGSPTQSFMSIVIGTEAGDNQFDVSWWNPQSLEVFSTTVSTGQILELTGGATWVLVGGIELEAQIDPNSPTAFVAGFTFAEAGAVSVYQTAQVGEYTPPVPEPASLVLLLGGLMGLHLVRRQRAR